MKKPSKEWLPSFVFYGAMLIAVCALVYLVAPAWAGKLFPEVDKVILLLLCALSYFLAIAARELGRVAFGCMAGQHLVKLKLGPLLVEPVFGKRKPRWAGFLPFAYSALTPPGSRLSKGMHVLGGPLMNLIAGLGALLGYRVAPRLGGLSAFLLLVFGMNAFLALWQLIPMRLFGVPNRAHTALRRKRAHLKLVK